MQGWPEDGAGGQGTLQEDSHSCVSTGVLRKTGGVQDWLSRGRGTGNAPGGWSQLYLCVLTCVTVPAHWPDWKGQGRRGRCH